jgi:hypothetical protein
MLSNILPFNYQGVLRSNVSDMFRVQTSASILTTLTQILCFPQSIPINSDIIPRIIRPSMPFAFFYQLKLGGCTDGQTRTETQTNGQKQTDAQKDSKV